MADASYNRQHLATHAAGFINAAGSTYFGFGCQMTQLATGSYAMILDPSAGVVDDDSFLQVQVKGTAARAFAVDDISDVVKNILTFDAAGAAANTDVEVALFKSVTKS